jgi:hypothetical protein
MLQGSFAEPTPCNRSNSIGHAAVDLHIDNQAFAMIRLVDAKEPATQHGHPHTQHLAGTDTAPMHLRSINQ